MKYNVRIGTDYFGELHEVATQQEVIDLVNDNPNMRIRVDWKDKKRVLLEPQVDFRRLVEGTSSLAGLFELFNDVKHPDSSVSWGTRTRIYTNRRDLKSCIFTDPQSNPAPEA